MVTMLSYVTSKDGEIRETEVEIEGERKRGREKEHKRKNIKERP